MVLKIDLRDQSVEHLQLPGHRLRSTPAVALLQKAIPDRLVPHHRESDQVEDHARRQVVAIKPLRRHARRRQSAKTTVPEEASNRPSRFGKGRSGLEVRLDGTKPGAKVKPFVCRRIELVDPRPAQPVKQKIETSAWKLLHSRDSPHAHRLAQRHLAGPRTLALVDHRHRDRIGFLQITISSGETSLDHLPIPRLEDVKGLRSVRQKRHARKQEERDGLSEIDAVGGHLSGW